MRFTGKPRGRFRRLSLIALAAWCGCGFMVMVPTTCAQRRAIAQQERQRAKEIEQWERAVEERYNLVALHAFLRRTIADTPQREDADLTKPRLDAAGWVKTQSFSLICGAWSFHANSLEKTDFVLSFVYTTTDGKMRRLDIECRQLDRGRFQVVRFKSEDAEVIILSV